MAELNTGKLQDLNIADLKSKMSNAVQDVAETLQENRPLMYVGIGLLVIAAGVGIWALVRQFTSEDEQTHRKEDYLHAGEI